jgi:RND family efflux transporter MFP subunit
MSLETPTDLSSEPGAGHGSAPDTGVRPIRKGRLAIVGLIAAAGAVAAAVNGISARAHNETELVTWTNAQAVPTVAVVQAKQEDQVRSITLPGTIQAFYAAPIYPRVTGYVKSWSTDIGAKVHKGQELAEIDTPDLDQQIAQAQANVANAYAANQLASTTAKRWHQLLGYQTVSQQDEDEKASDAISKHAALQAAMASLGQLVALGAYKQVKAPFDGIVTARRTDIGDLVTPGSSGQPMFQISDVHKVRIYVQVPQAFSAELHPGIKATLSMPQYPGRTFDATLVTTSNAFAEASRTVQVQLQADNPDDRLWPGTFTEVSFKLPADSNVLRLPATALLFDAHGTRVAVVGNGDKVAFKTVKLGRNLGNNAEILSGITTADRVIDSPPEYLGTGDAVRLAENNLARN